MRKICGLLFAGGTWLAGCNTGANPEAIKAAPVTQVTATSEQKPEYTVHDFDTVALAPTPTSLKAYGITIGRPARWVEDTTPARWACQERCPALAGAAGFCANYVVTSMARNPNIALTVYADTLLNRAERRADVEAFHLISSTPQVINGLPTLTVDYKALVGKQQLGGIFTLVELPNKLLIITFLGPNNPPKSYVRYRGLYERIIQSIKPI